MRFHDLLVPTDFGPAASRALELALAVAAKTGGRVHVAHSFEPPGSMWMTDAYKPTVLPLDAMIAAARAALEGVAERARAVLPAVDTTWVEGDPRQTILEAATARGADAIFMGTHGRRGFAHALLGSVAEQLVRVSPVPVLSARAPEASRPPIATLRHVLVPLDLVAPAEQALETGADLAQQFGARLTLLHVCARETGHEAGELDRLAASVSARCPEVDRVLVRGHPVDRILSAVTQSGVDLVVVGTSRRSGLARVVLGSVAERLVRLCPAPLLTIASPLRAAAPLAAERHPELG